MITQFTGFITGNTVRDEPKFGESQGSQKPYAVLKMAVNNSGDNPATYFTVVTWNPNTINFLKQKYRKGMLLTGRISRISSLTIRDDDGEFVREEFFFNADYLHEIKMEKLAPAEDVPAPKKEEVEEEEKQEAEVEL